jgi:hypothetical protein
MREIRTSGSEGGGAEPNLRSLPLSWPTWVPASAGMEIRGKLYRLRPAARRRVSSTIAKTLCRDDDVGEVIRHVKRHQVN